MNCKNLSVELNKNIDKRKTLQYEKLQTFAKRNSERFTKKHPDFSYQIGVLRKK